MACLYIQRTQFKKWILFFLTQQIWQLTIVRLCDIPRATATATPAEATGFVLARSIFLCAAAAVIVVVGDRCRVGAAAVFFLAVLGGRGARFAAISISYGYLALLLASCLLRFTGCRGNTAAAATLRWTGHLQGEIRLVVVQYAHANITTHTHAYRR